MNKIKVTVLALTLLFIVVFLTLIIFNKQKLPQCVADEEAAIVIGRTICKSVYPDFDLEDDKWEVIDADDQWYIFYHPFEDTTGGGYPGVRIRKSDSKVMDIFLAK